MRTQGTYYIRGTEGRKDGRKDGRNAENYVPPLFFEKAGDNKDGASSGRLRRDQNNAPKKKIDTDRVSKGSDDPIKSHNMYDALSEEGMEAETTPASPRKGHIERLPIIYFFIQLI